jgi:uncharacterized protein
MSLELKINEDIKKAMLARDARSLEALRAIKSGLLLLKTEKGPVNEIPESVELGLVQKLVRQRRDSAALYREKGRADLAEVEEFQASVIEAYLPAQMSEEELIELLKGIINQVGAKAVSDIGKVMGVASKQLAGKADNSKVASLIRSLLS